MIACPAASRRRATFSVTKTSTSINLGFKQRRSEKLEPLTDCKILHPALAMQLEQLRVLAAAVPAGKLSLGVTLCDGGLDVNIACQKLQSLRASQISTFVAKMREGKFPACIVEWTKPSLSFKSRQSPLTG